MPTHDGPPIPAESDDLGPIENENERYASDIAEPEIVVRDPHLSSLLTNDTLSSRLTRM